MRTATRRSATGLALLGLALLPVTPAFAGEAPAMDRIVFAVGTPTGGRIESVADDGSDRAVWWEGGLRPFDPRLSLSGDRVAFQGQGPDEAIELVVLGPQGDAETILSSWGSVWPYWLTRDALLLPVIWSGATDAEGHVLLDQGSGVLVRYEEGAMDRVRAPSGMAPASGHWAPDFPLGAAPLVSGQGDQAVVPWSGGVLSLLSYDDGWTARRDILRQQAAWAAWSPDSSLLAVISNDSVLVLDPITASYRTAAVASGTERPIAVTWSGDGTRLIVRVTNYDLSQSSLLSVRADAVDADLAARTNDVALLAGDLGSGGPIGRELSRPGSPWLFGNGTSLLMVGADGLTVDDLLPVVGPAMPFAWSPDGTRVAIERGGGIGVLDLATLGITDVVTAASGETLHGGGWTPLP